MRIRFVKVRPEDIELLPDKAIGYLEDGLAKTPANVDTIEDMLKACALGFDELYLIYGEALIGCIILHQYDTIINTVNMGVSSLEDIKDDLLAFLKGFNKQVVSISRKGWEKIYPEFKIIGHVYSLEV